MRTNPGVSYIEMHELVESILAKHLLKMGLLQGRLEDIISAGIPAIFMPHGLGHNMGLETHDVGGYPEDSKRATRPGLKSLRNVRPLKPGMVLTIEPGCYFIPSELEKGLADSKMAPFMNADKLREMFGFGGVRLEDNVVVTEEGVEVLTDVPRNIADLEALIGSAHQ
jgi:Xaa-Pro dipeptidase